VLGKKWISTSRRMKFKLYHINILSKWIKKLNIRPETIRRKQRGNTSTQLVRQCYY
jgi:hypothetical protein